MAITRTIPNLGTSNAAFDAYFMTFTTTRQSDGEGGVVYQCTLTANIKDDQGQPYEQASYTWEPGPAALSSLRDYLIAQAVPGLKAQEGL